MIFSAKEKILSLHRRGIIKETGTIFPKIKYHRFFLNIETPGQRYCD